MAKKSDFQARGEYILLRVVCALVNVIPWRVACGMAYGAAFIAFRVLGINRRRTLERLKSVFPQMTPRAAKRVAVKSLANIFCNVVEMIRAPKLNRRWMEKHIRDAAVYADRLRGYVAEGKGVVIMVPHTGNWYMAAWCMAQFGVPLFAIAARQRNPYINAWMNRQYGEGLEVLERGSAATMRDILTRLRKGKAFAILPDLRVPQRDVQVSFLNGTANVSHAGALFAVSTGAPIVVAAMQRVKGGHAFNHIATLRPNPDAADRKAEAARLTVEVMGLLDGAIQADPGQWFWFNKRWILQDVKERRV